MLSTIAPEADERLEALKEQADQNLPNNSILEGLSIKKIGNAVDEKNKPLDHVKFGNLEKMPDAQGKVWDSRDNVPGEVEGLPDAAQNTSGPFEYLPNATVVKHDRVIFDGCQVGVLVGNELQNFIGKKVDTDGDFVNKNDKKEKEPKAEPKIDHSALADKRINKAGNVVDSHGDIYGRVVKIKRLIRNMCNKTGTIRNEGSNIIGHAELILVGSSDGGTHTHD
ncbi:hypothetical protein PG985_005561 [Apiospora marii]|uniref:uncharacterized protein n=1 Tax=Apiospora marii TaxID=335849 RepID=UPI00312EE0F5